MPPTVDSVLNPGTSAEIDPTFRAVRMSIRPLEYQTLQGKILGHYRIFGQGAAALVGTNALLANFRWTDPTNFAVITRVYATMTVVTPLTATRADPITLSIARAYTVNDGTNMTALVVSGNNQKMRSNMGSSVVGNIGVYSTAAGGSGGTRTVDANPVGALAFTSQAIAVGTGIIGDLYKWDVLGQHPIVLAANEGLLVSWGVTAQVGGTSVMGVGFEWAEVPAF